MQYEPPPPTKKALRISHLSRRYSSVRCHGRAGRHHGSAGDLCPVHYRRPRPYHAVVLQRAGVDGRSGTCSVIFADANT